MMMSKIAILLAGTGLFVATSVQAQQPATPVPASDQGLEDIIVTAQKREQNLQSVPVSVTALSAEAIVNQRINDFGDLSRAAASLTLTQAATTVSNSPVLRGIGTNVFSTSVEPSVSVIIDDIAVIQQAQAFDALSDIQRIEVLKGPQGLLFGKNASAGAINIVTADPSTTLSGLIQASSATNGEYRGDLSLSGPLGESISARLSAYYRSYDGNVFNLNDGRKLNDQESYGGRLKVKFALSDDIAYTVTGNYAKTTQRGTGSTIRSVSGTPRVLGSAALPFLPTLTGIDVGEGNYNARLDANSATTSEQFAFAGRGVFKLGGVDLLSITAYQDWKYNFAQDVDQSALNVLAAFTGGTVNGGITQSGPYHTKNFTQELRLVSTAPGPLKYVAGAYYSNASTTRAFLRGPTVLVANWDSEAKTRSFAAFGQIDYTLPTQTTISGGVRFNKERIAVAFDNRVATATAATCVTGTAACRGSNVDNSVTYKVAVSQQLAPKVLIYGSVARGYKGFAYDVSTGFVPARLDGTLGPVRPERSTAFEIGLKSRTADNRVQLNVAAFLTNFADFQAQGGIIVNNVTQLQLSNVGKLRSKGIEADLSVQAAPWLRFDGSAAYVDAIMTSFPKAQAFVDQTGAVFANGVSSLVGNCIEAPVATAAAPRRRCTFQDRSGARLPNAPQFKFNIGATGDVPIDANSSATFTLNYQHQSSVNFDLYGNPLTVQAAYGVLNGSIGIKTAGFSITAFVNNLLDKHYSTNVADSFATFGGSDTNPAHVITQFHPKDSERYFGVRAAYRF
jgi:iron complex outermembrane recepter protein